MSELTFKGFKDAGAPELSQVDGIMSIAYAAGQRGRFLTENIEAVPNETHVLRGEYRVTDNATALPVVVLWKPGAPWQLFGTIKTPVFTNPGPDFIGFELSFTLTEAVGSFRVELRAWAGSGVTEFRNVTLDEEILPDPPTPEPEPQIEWAGFIRGNQMVLQRPTTEGQALADWPCLPVIAVEWGDNFYLTVVRPEPEPKPEPVE